VPSRARWFAAVFCVMYGFDKLNGAQFTVLDSELARPMGQVSGFWLTWYYFGYSAFYGTIIALVQVGASVLLAFRRTALLGALLLMPVFANIILIDVFFGVDPGATLVAFVIFGCLLAVIAPHWQRVRAAVLLEAAPHRLAPRVATLGAILVFAFASSWWIANDNNRLPTSIDGSWAVVSQSGRPSGASPWQRVFFERNRAHWVTFRSATSDEVHHFEVDPDGVVRVWQTWLSKGALIMQGRVLADGDVQLDAIPGATMGNVRLQRTAGPHEEPSILAAFRRQRP
jgi:hypothetical protein